MIKKLSVKGLLSADAYGTEFFITEADLYAGDERTHIDIPLDARVAVDEKGRWTLSQSQNRRWRWSAGGAVAVLRFADASVLPVSVSDADLPVWAGHLKAPTGVSGSTEEWVRPRRLMREAFEAIAVATPMGLVVPSFGDAELDALAFGALPTLTALIDKEADLPPIFHSGLFNVVSAKLLPLRGAQDVVVSVDGEVHSRTKALVVLDPQTRGIDLMQAYELDLRATLLDEASFLYTEAAGGRALNAEVALLLLDDHLRVTGISRSYRSGNVISGAADINKISPVLRETLAAL